MEDQRVLTQQRTQGALQHDGVNKVKPRYNGVPGRVMSHEEYKVYSQFKGYNGIYMASNQTDTTVSQAG